MLFNKDITVFSSYKDNRETKYIKTLLPKSAFVDSTEIINTNTNGMVNANKILVLLPKIKCDQYVAPRQFEKMENKKDYFTLQKGDYIAKGLILNDYDSMTELSKKEENVYVITAIDDKDYGSYPYFEIAGK